MTVNKVNYRGNKDGADILEDICAYIENPPSGCNKNFNDFNDGESNIDVD